MARPYDGARLEPENSPIFKVSRVLWFPMSVNAVALGAVCCVLFWLWSAFSSLIVGQTDYEVTMASMTVFVARVWGWLQTGGLDGLTERESWMFLLQAIGAYVLWSIGGIAIARIMAVRIARDEYITIKEALAFAWSTRFTALLYAPAILLSMAFLFLAIFGVGLVGQIPWLGWLVSAVVLPVVIFFTILVRILAWAGVVSLGMTAGAIACEKKGTWDSVAKAFNYLFARPLQVLLYVALLWVFVRVVQGLLLGEDNLRAHVSRLLMPIWGKDWDYAKIARGATSELDGFAKAAAWLHSAVFWIVDALIRGAILSWIVGAFTAMFLIFRKEIDGTDYSDIVKAGEQAPA
jgi:hypothetical protein